MISIFIKVFVNWNWDWGMKYRNLKEKYLIDIILIITMSGFIEFKRDLVNNKKEKLKGKLDREKSMNPFEKRRLERLERLKKKSEEKKENS